MNNIGNLYQVQGQYDKALEYQKKSLAMRKIIYGDNHPDVAESLYRVGLIYRDLKQYAQSLQHLKQALVIQREAFGEKHPHVEHTISSISFVDEALQDKARRKYKRPMM